MTYLQHKPQTHKIQCTMGPSPPKYADNCLFIQIAHSTTIMHFAEVLVIMTITAGNCGIMSSANLLRSTFEYLSKPNARRARLSWTIPVLPYSMHASFLADGGNLSIADLVWSANIILQIHLLAEVHLGSAGLWPHHKTDLTHTSSNIHAAEQHETLKHE